MLFAVTFFEIGKKKLCMHFFFLPFFLARLLGYLKIPRWRKQSVSSWDFSAG